LGTAGAALTLCEVCAGASGWSWSRCAAIPKAKDQPQQTHDKLEDFLLIYDELNDNIDTYLGRKDDIRKPLKVIIDADTGVPGQSFARLKDAADVLRRKKQSGTNSF
jgi:hypothetical protein